MGREACRGALDELGESLAMRETAALIGDVDEEGWQAIRGIAARAGPSSVEALKPIAAVEHETLASRRAEDLIETFGTSAVPRLASLVGDPRWFAQRAGARLLGRTRAAEAVPLLQPLLRKGDARVAREAIAALGAIDDPSAARAIHTVLRAATGALRRAIVDALVADRDPRVVPMIARIIGESHALGKDHEVVLEAVAALGSVGSDTAIPTLAAVIQRGGFFGRRKLRALKTTGVAALSQIGGPRAIAALEEARRTGDRMLKKVVANRR